MNTIVWVLVVTVNSGHFSFPMVPTLEFTTEEKCKAAIREFKESAEGRTGSFNGWCVRIEK